jgi:hypothetical protein
MCHGRAELTLAQHKGVTHIAWRHPSDPPFSLAAGRTKGRVERDGTRSL